MAESAGIGSGALRIGSGLVEIAALTALVGSSTAGSLMLGNRGAVGLAWGAMSMFGILSMIKACIAAATPAWLRETMGVRSIEADDALGLSLMLGNEEFKARNSMARDTVGIVSEIYKVCVCDELSKLDSWLHILFRCDRSIATLFTKTTVISVEIVLSRRKNSCYPVPCA